MNSGMDGLPAERWMDHLDEAAASAVGITTMQRMECKNMDTLEMRSLLSDKVVWKREVYEERETTKSLYHVVSNVERNPQQKRHSSSSSYTASWHQPSPTWHAGDTPQTSDQDSIGSRIRAQEE